MSWERRTEEWRVHETMVLRQDAVKPSTSRVTPSSRAAAAARVRSLLSGGAAFARARPNSLWATAHRYSAALTGAPWRLRLV
jgi:hypothetical protein